MGSFIEHLTDGLLDREDEKGEIIHAKVKRFWFVSRGNRADKGNRNIKFHVLEDHVLTKVENPWGKWVFGKAYFGKEYLQSFKELGSYLEGRRRVTVL
jgi:hypothetical protein